jgi:hypothetical protein
MPNWCTNVVEVSGGSEREMDALYELLKDTDKPFSTIFPQPKLEGDEDWYDWNIANWGTKWEAEDFRISRGDGLYMTFSTAWSPSLELTKRMSELFPTLSIRHFYEEPGMAFEGVANFESGTMEDNFRDMPRFDNPDEHEEYMNTPVEDRLRGDDNE